MGNKGRSDPNLFGGYTHYDAKGHKIGSSEPGLFGGFVDYDSKGHKIGHTDPGVFGGYTHYDNHGHKIGRSDPGLFGSYEHYDAKGTKTGSSDPSPFGSYSNKGAQGCYVATCVYGSYDCPEVWTLRRFRDDYLAKSTPGRLFIRIYYTVSPMIVRWFGGQGWFKRFWRGKLDRLVIKLRSEGVESSPYKDQSWR